MSIVKKAIDTLTGRTLAEAAEETRKTAKCLRDEIAKARAKVDAERNEDDRKKAAGAA